ncbi:MAG: SDR family oxidoreductase [Thermoplasmata archaeon]|uniref:SDR family oxidoreductase n=1 Tax=Candidatus Sysuiplasma superficiale TaxID=2823368 RepID=A0A8J8CDT4_9ARCH|nr:SDR family oxidoreductase [Candidatus Sysuiplasma superficiale]
MGGRLRERRVLVVGGSGNIGSAIVRALAAEGAFVAMASRAGQRLKDASQRMKKDGFDVFAVVLDVTSPESVDEAVHLLGSHWGGIDVLFNCAGTGMAEFNPGFAHSAIPFYSYRLNALRTAMDTDYFGCLAVMQAFIPVFREQGRGMIVNVSIDQDMANLRGFAPIFPAKAAVNALTAIAAREFEGSGISVNLLTPGGFVGGGMIPTDAPEENFGKLLSPEVMADAAVFLASDEASGINGRHIVAREFSRETFLNR